RVGRGPAFDPRKAHAVGAGLFEPDRREVGDAIGRDVLARVAHLVKQLLFDRRDGDAPAGAFVLGYHEGAVGLRLDDRVTDVGEVGNGLPVDQAIAAGTLRAALDRVPGNRPCGQQVPGVGGPFEFVNHWPERQPRVGDAPADDDLPALV